MSRRKLERYQARVSSLKEKSKLFNTMYTSLEKSEKIYVAKFGKTVKREDGSRVDGQFEPDEGEEPLHIKILALIHRLSLKNFFMPIKMIIRIVTLLVILTLNLKLN